MLAFEQIAIPVGDFHTFYAFEGGIVEMESALR